MENLSKRKSVDLEAHVGWDLHCFLFHWQCQPLFCCDPVPSLDGLADGWLR
jgi:hypothetical protein